MANTERSIQAVITYRVKIAPAKKEPISIPSESRSERLKWSLAGDGEEEAKKQTECSSSQL